MKPMKSYAIAFSLAATVIGASIPAQAEDSGHHTQAASAAVTPAQAGAALRDLWIGHTFWVRNVVVETLAGNAAAASAAENEVVANAKQIAAAIEPFYGQAAADKLFNLLAGHYGATKQYLEATVAGSQKKQAKAVQGLNDNVEAIAVFLSGANPNLPRDALRGLLLAHVGHHLQQIQQLQGKQYAQEAQTWGMMKAHMYMIADALAAALAKQFPDKFG